MRNLVFVFCLVSLVGLSQSNEQSKSTIIFLVRHAEKADDGTKNPPLNETGNDRAMRLAKTLSNSSITAIYSTDYKRTKSTVEPLAKTTGLEIKIYEPKKEEVLQSIVDENRGGVVVICGHSNTTPWSANVLAGTQLKSFDETEYGNILIVTIWSDGKTSLTKISY